MKPFAPSSPERFVQLDALRFAFAVIVVLVHTIGFKLTLIHGGFAVDFFFVLSGFVLSHALIHRPAPSAQFARARLARLYPGHAALASFPGCRSARRPTEQLPARATTS